MTYHQPTVNRIKCNGCEACVDICPEEIFEVRRGKSRVYFSHSCTACLACIKVCEQKAVKIEELEVKGVF